MQYLRCLIRGGQGGLNLNETLSHSNSKFVFDHGPKWIGQGRYKGSDSFF